jgi:hypothetical protein
VWRVAMTLGCWKKVLMFKVQIPKEVVVMDK